MSSSRRRCDESLICKLSPQGILSCKIGPTLHRESWRWPVSCVGGPLPLRIEPDKYQECSRIFDKNMVEENLISLLAPSREKTLLEDYRKHCAGNRTHRAGNRTHPEKWLWKPMATSDVDFSFAKRGIVHVSHSNYSDKRGQSCLRQTNHYQRGRAGILSEWRIES